MSKYTLIILDAAKKDIIDLSYTNRFEYKSPTTAVKYLRGLNKEMNRLKNNAQTFSIQSGIYFSQYGFNVRRLNYKKMAIIYTVLIDTVFIQRVIPSSTITGV